ncbi:MAG TPA: nitrilase-related carbon-nitrogen hydrolase [Candidatus Limnocylindrales bacterium]|nr:nitrilase-related carbon-nitrogen hydrolase [Candidatus Limnocylindrales bacterium]
MDEGRRLRVAAVQAAPVFLDAEATVDKAVGLIERVAEGGAELVAFGEGFLPGHPIWLHVVPVTSSAQIRFAERLVRAAVTIPGPAVERLAAAARRTGVGVVVGVVERLGSGSALASAAVVLTADGRVSARRKLVPAVGERVLFTPGGGDSIRIFEARWGRLAVLLGGESSNPLLTWTLRELGAHVIVAAWPPHFNKPGVMGDVASITGRAIAYQNGAYVVSVFGATDEATRAEIAPDGEAQRLLEVMAADPGTTVYAPRGALAAGPLPGGEGILFADLDLEAGVWARLVGRHYDRPDLFRVTVDRRPSPSALAADEGAAPGTHDLFAGGSADLAARARNLIAERYGDRLDPSDAERLVPFVVSVLETSERLSELELTSFDPLATTYVEDPRAG